MALLMFERVENLAYVTWIRRLNSVRNMRIVNGRFSSRYVVRGFGFCDLNSPDISRRVIFRRAICNLRHLLPVLMSLSPVINNTDAILPIMATNLFQRLLELDPRPSTQRMSSYLARHVQSRQRQGMLCP